MTTINEESERGGVHAYTYERRKVKLSRVRMRVFSELVEDSNVSLKEKVSEM